MSTNMHTESSKKIIFPIAQGIEKLPGLNIYTFAFFGLS